MQRQRITITVDPELIGAVDATVDGSQIRNRSHAIEHLIKEGLGLTRLSAIFLFLEDGWRPDYLASLLESLSPLECAKVFLVGDDAPSLADASLQVASWRPNATVVHVPASFGSAGAVILQKDQIEGPFFLAWIGSVPSLVLHPLQLLGFHLQHHAPLTQVFQADRRLPFAVANPELLAHVPAGKAELQESVFPELEKLGKVRAYVQRT